MSVVTYATVHEDLQSTLYTIINEDTTSITFHNGEIGTLANAVTVLDGIPNSLTQNTGYPYVLVQTPNALENRKTSTKFGIGIVAPIEIFDKKEKNIRRIVGAIRSALINNQATTRSLHLNELKIETLPLTRHQTDTGTLYNGHVRARYKVYVTT